MGVAWKIKTLEMFNIISVFFWECLWFLFGCVERLTVVLVVINQRDILIKMVDGVLEVAIKWSNLRYYEAELSYLKTPYYIWL
jgi:hypothetical protein